MDKKSLIGVSICAVVLLVMGSLSNVVGYQSVKSSVNDSPLFQTRTQRATNQQQNSITSQFLGMKKGNFLQFSIQYTRTDQQKKAIEIINNMDDKTFQQFTKLCIQRLKQDNSFKDTNPNDIIKALMLIKKQHSSYPFIQNEIIKNDWDTTIITICYWLPGCWLYTFFIMFPALIVYYILVMVFDFPNTLGCYP